MISINVKTLYCWIKPFTKWYFSAWDGNRHDIHFAFLFSFDSKKIFHNPNIC